MEFRAFGCVGGGRWWNVELVRASSRRLLRRMGGVVLGLPATDDAAPDGAWCSLGSVLQICQPIRALILITLEFTLFLGCFFKFANKSAFFS